MKEQQIIRITIDMTYEEGTVMNLNKLYSGYAQNIQYMHKTLYTPANIIEIKTITAQNVTSFIK